MLPFADSAELPFQPEFLCLLVNGVVVVDQAEALAAPEAEHEDQHP